MTLLVVSPDYASHLYPLATLATAWRDAGERVVVATGPATDALVRGFGYEREHLQLGRGSNPGVIRAPEVTRPTAREDRRSRRCTPGGTLIGPPSPTRAAFTTRARPPPAKWKPGC